MTPSSSLFLARTTNAAFARGVLVSMCTQPVAKTLSCFSFIFLHWKEIENVSQKSRGTRTALESPEGGASRTNLIDGGVPAGTRSPPEEEGCRRKRTRIRTITRHGNRRTKPKGIEIDEFPLSRILRLKKANLGSTRPFSRGGSSRGRVGAEGSRFEIRCMNPISTEGESVADASRKVEPVEPEEKDYSSSKCDNKNKDKNKKF